MTKVRALLVGVVAALVFVAGCGLVSDPDQARQEVKKKVEAKGQQVQKEAKKKVEAAKEDLEKKVDDLHKKVDDVQKKLNELLKKVDAQEQQDQKEK